VVLQSSVSGGGRVQRNTYIDGRRYFILSEMTCTPLLLQTECGKLRLAVNESGTLRLIGPDPGKNEDMVHESEVRSLNEFQAKGCGHPFTYDLQDRGGVDETCAQVDLIATPLGWVAEKGGPVVQTWAWKFMSDNSWKENPFYKHYVERA
jgi:hypothetical protein